MAPRMNLIAVTALCGLILAALPAPRAHAQGGFDSKPIWIARASEPRGLKVQAGDLTNAQQCARLFSNTLFVLYEDFSMEIRTPDGRQVHVFFRHVTIEPMPTVGVNMRTKMQGKIESGPFAGATIRVTGESREMGTLSADIQVVQGAEPGNDLPPWWPAGEGQTQGATLDTSFWVLLRLLWVRGS